MSQGQVFKECAEIVHKEKPTQDSCLMVFHAPQIAATIEPGQFVNVLPPFTNKPDRPYYGVVSDEERTQKFRTANPHEFSLLRRPFSLHGLHRKGTSFSILFRIIGKGTQLIEQQQQGDTLDILGPLGKPYPLPENPQQRIFIVAGGFGVAPLIPLAYRIGTRGNRINFFWGTVDQQNIPLPVTETEPSYSGYSKIGLKHLHEAEIPSLIAIDEGGKGAFKGTVLELFKRFIEVEPIREEPAPLVYTCGPEMMMKAVTEVAQAKNWFCRVSLEKYMACGLGACMSCVCKIRKSDEDSEFHYLRTCTEGPSFWGEYIIW